MIKKGEIVYGKITNILGYGAFVSVGEYDGLIHISEFSDKYVRSIDEYVSVGQRVKLKVLDVDEKAKRLKLSYKLLHKQRGVKGKFRNSSSASRRSARRFPISSPKNSKKSKGNRSRQICLRKGN